jgi:DNA-binding response OmpR family regulator
MATRMSVLTRALPMRILLVDDDELELALLADRIRSAGFEVERALNGREALQRLDAHWFPLIVTDWKMPEMDGITFTETLRARGVDDTYVIMLTMREATLDYERGYLAGVDDYLTKRLPDAELFARIHAAFNTIALRRSLKEAQTALLTASPIDTRTGAFTAAETLAKLQSELHRADRYGRVLSILLVEVSTGGSNAAPSTDVLRTVVQTIQHTIRNHVDWTGHVAGPNDAALIAIVLPEAPPGEGPRIKERLREALGKLECAVPLSFDFGLVGLNRAGGDQRSLDAAELLQVAEQCVRCNGRKGPMQLSAVQRSVAVGATIACRHGYALDSYCTLKPSAAQQGASDPATRVRNE